MFKLMDYRQGYIVCFAIFVLILAAVQSHEANKFINHVNEENRSNSNIPRLQTAAYGTIILAIVILVLAIILPMELQSE